MSAAQFTMERARWYALTMYPGYGPDPYCSPIRVDHVTALGAGLLEVIFLNAGYASGMQDMKKKYRVHRRGERHLVLNEIQQPERTVILEPLTAEWIATRAAWFVERMVELRAG